MKRIGILILIILGISSCGGDKSEPVLLESIRGKWIIESATRNNKETSLLNGGYLLLTDSTFSTNLFKNEKPNKYIYDGNKISVLDSLKTTFDVKSMTSDTLIVWTKFHKMDFKLKTVKAPTEK